MQKRRKHRKQPNRPMVFSALKGAVVALIFTITALLVFALAVKSAGLEDNVIVIINQIIKVAGIGVAALLAARDADERGVVTAGVAGLLYIVIGFVVFSMMQGSLGDGVLLIADGAMGLVIGLVMGLFVCKVLKKAKTT